MVLFKEALDLTGDFVSKLLDLLILIFLYTIIMLDKNFKLQ